VTAIGNATNQVDAVLLHLLVTVLEDGREARQEVLDGRRHLGHADHVHNGLETAEDATEHLGVLLAQALVEHHAKMAHELLLLALAHYHRDLANEIGRLLTHPRAKSASWG